MQARNLSATPSRSGTARRPVAPFSKGDATAERILNATFKSIAVHGCGAVTMRGIADEAGVALSHGAVYIRCRPRITQHGGSTKTAIGFC
jgi:hypothetical protein